MGRAERCLLLAAGLASACSPLRPDRPIGPPLAPVDLPATVTAARGESACVLAGRSGIDPRALLRANGLAQPPELPLREGALEVPANAGLRHQIQAGETLHALARWYGHSVAALASANGIADPALVHAGTWLAIPPGARTGCPPAAPSVARRLASVPPPAAKAPAARSAALGAPPTPEPGAAEDLLPVDDLLAEARERYDTADFEAVLELTQAVRRALASRADDAARRERHAHATWLAGLAHAGLDRRDEAIASLHEALALRPSLRDDPSLSPRILGLLDAEEPPRAQP